MLQILLDFGSCFNLEEIPDTINLPSTITNISSMFYNCSSLKKLPAMDTSHVTNFQSCFEGCSSLTSIPNYDFSSATNVSLLFSSCTHITSLPNLNWGSGVTTLNSTFAYCNALVDFPVLDLSSITNLYNKPWNQCPSLSNTAIQNILKSLLTLTSSYVGTKTLTSMGFNTTQKTTAQTFPEWTELQSAGWTA